ncbi:MAG: hypothetical protein FWE57_07505 [Chitinispirillia bacterium]|nr:hypothetical protein [Chitinispirillia bacterium]
MKFSERYGYTKPSTVLIREEMTEEIINVVCTGYDLLKEKMKTVKSLSAEFVTDALRNQSKNHALS